MQRRGETLAVFNLQASIGSARGIADVPRTALDNRLKYMAVQLIGPLIRCQSRSVGGLFDNPPDIDRSGLFG